MEFAIFLYLVGVALCLIAIILPPQIDEDIKELPYQLAFTFLWPLWVALFFIGCAVVAFIELTEKRG